jgi:hypothetical protein
VGLWTVILAPASSLLNLPPKKKNRQLSHDDAGIDGSFIHLASQRNSNCSILFLQSNGNRAPDFGRLRVPLAAKRRHLHLPPSSFHHQDVFNFFLIEDESDHSAHRRCEGGRRSYHRSCNHQNANMCCNKQADAHHATPQRPPANA